MFNSVVLPAPFSPSRACTSPGATDRSIWSLATSEPKRLVMPFSSSSTSALQFRDRTVMPVAYSCPRQPLARGTLQLARRCGSDAHRAAPLPHFVVP